MIWWTVFGCNDPSAPDAVVGDDSPPAPVPHTGADHSAPSTGTTDTALPPTFPDDCDPTVHVPGAFGLPDPERTAEPHQEVYGAEPLPFALHLSPVGSDPSVSMGFVWRTDLDTLATVLEYGARGDPATTLVPGASFTYGGVEGSDFRLHEVKLCRQLLPGTTYRYRVGGPGGLSDWYEFSTPDPAAQNLRVAFAGDSRGSYAQWAIILQGLVAADPDLLLFAGDFVNVGTSQLEWDYWFRAGETVLPETLLVPAHGNHEFLATNWFAQWSLPGNEQWYQFRQGPMHLVVLNDTASSDDLATQAEYVRDVLGPSDATWKVVMHHQSLYATCSRHGSNVTLRDLWAPVFEEVGVDLVIGGHNHVYERSVPLRAGLEVGAGAGITYLVTGGAGAPLYRDFDVGDFNAVALAVEHGVVVDFGPTDAHFVVRDSAAAVIDDFVLPADP